MNTPKYIIVHHTGVSYAKNSDQFKATDNYHRSLGWGGCGYHYEISKAGKIYTGRDERKVGCHCTQKSMNFQSIGIVLDGNFDTEKPTPEQEASLKGLLQKTMAKYSIPIENIKYHREYANKTCPGKLIASDWAKNLVKKTINPTLKNKFLLSVEEKGKLYYLQGEKLIENKNGELFGSFLSRLGLLVGITKKDLESLK